MDNTTQQSNNQPLPLDALSATLAHATNLQESMLPKAPIQPTIPSQTPQNAPGQEISQQMGEDTKSQIDALESRIMDELKNLKEMMDGEKDDKSEIATLKAEIKAALNEHE